MIHWWNSRTIPIAETLWKPGLNPRKQININNHSWYNSSIHKHQKVKQFTYENKEPIKEFITRKIKMNPNKEQRKTLIEWWNAYRYTYNKTIEEIGNESLHETTKVAINIDVLNDSTIKLDLGYRFELKRKWKLDFKYIDEPKVKLKINYDKNKTKITSTKITILQDPLVKQIHVNYHFEYPQMDSWYTFRNKLVSAKIHQFPKLVPEFEHLTNQEVKIANQKPFFKDKQWLLNVHKSIRGSAVKDARASYETICTLSKDYGKKSTLGPLPFKRKKYNDSWSIGIEKECIQPCYIEKTTIGRKHKKLGKPKQIQAFYVCPQKLKTPILCYEKIPEEFGDPKIHKDKWGDWWLLLPIKKQHKFIKTQKQGIALDPGIKTFMTGYTTHGKIYNYVEDELLLMKLLRQISKIQSLVDNNQQPKHSSQILNNLRKQMQHKIDDMHWKVINDLTKKNNLIVIGKLNVQSILKSSTITKSAKRKLQVLSHFQFKQRLKYKAASLGVLLKTQNEWGTTKGCPCCGWSNKLTLADRIFKCIRCEYSANRDDKAACCIMLKYMANVW